ncbi:DUF29 domain-containing protein [Methylobacterium sp. M6A4_1b]
MAHPKRADAALQTGTPYDVDLADWAMEQAEHLRTRTWSALDLRHLIDEVEAVARTERNALASALRVVLLHMLKWDHQPGRRTRSWATSIRVQRLAAEERMEDSPSLRGQCDEVLTRAYRRARIEAAAETDLPESAFPMECPYTVDEVMTRDFSWPQADREKALEPS